MSPLTCGNAEVSRYVHNDASRRTEGVVSATAIADASAAALQGTATKRR
jgi:hypothetical protein